MVHIESHGPLVMVRAEGDHVVAPRAGGDAGRVVVRIRVSPRARCLEYPRVRRGLAGLRRPEAPRAAVPARSQPCPVTVDETFKLDSYY